MSMSIFSSDLLNQRSPPKDGLRIHDRRKIVAASSKVCDLLIVSFQPKIHISEEKTIEKHNEPRRNDNEVPNFQAIR